MCCHSDLQAQPKDDSTKLKDVAYAVHNAEIDIALENEESMERALDNTHETVVGAENDQTYTKVLVGMESDKVGHDVIMVHTSSPMQHIQPKSHMWEWKMTEPQNQQEGIARTDPDSHKAKPKRQRKKDIHIVAMEALEVQLTQCKAHMTMLEETDKEYQNTIRLLTSKLNIMEPTIMSESRNSTYNQISAPRTVRR